MATHGTIWLTSTEEPKQHILLQTPHDGQTIDAIKMILSLSKFVADKHWYADVIARNDKNINLKTVQRFGSSQGDFGGTYLLTVAHWITSYHFDRWQIIPKGFEGYLADYDLEDKHHLKVIIDPYLWKESEQSETASGILICADFEEYKNSKVQWKSNTTLNQWINKQNKNMPEDAKIVTNWIGCEKGIFLPFYDRFVHDVLAKTQKIRKRIVDEN